jgi:hypothetical protein
LVTLVLLSLIVLALMTVFNGTQNAFRASLTQTDVLESGRNAMGLIVGDLETMTPSFGTNSVTGKGVSAQDFRGAISPVNFYANAYVNLATPNYQPFVQYLPGTSAQRSNVLEYFFILSRQNVNGSPSWVGTGYAVDPLSQPATNSLYRFSMTTNVITGNPLSLFTNFFFAVENRAFYNPFTNTASWSHLMDGVVDLTVRAYDRNGFWMTNTVDYYDGQFITNQSTYFFLPSPYLPPALKVYGFYMFSNTVPAVVEVNLGVWENSTRQRAEGFSVAGQLNYLSNHVGQVHLFRQRVLIRNVDPTAYQ